MFQSLMKVVSRGSFHRSCALSPLLTSSRGYKFLNVEINKEKGSAVITMNRPPVNSLNLEFLTELNMAFTKLEDEKSCRGVILTSNVPKIFSAGLDISEMYQPEPERLRLFWKTFQDLWQTLYGSSLIIFAGINGNSPAGGCMMSLACDYRIMTEGNFSIGLNETKLGIVAPIWFQDAMVNVVGQRQTEHALQLGEMYLNTEALKIKLVDKLVPVDQVLPSAHQEMDKWLTIPDSARIISKRQLHAATLEKFARIRDADLENIVTFMTGPNVQKGLGRYIENLKKKAEQKTSK